MHRFEFGRRQVAKEARKMIEPHWVHPEDDRRMTWIVATDETPRDVLEVLRWREYERGTGPQYGQMGLSAVEKAQIDFDRTNTFHARSVKAIAVGNGVDDWIAKYDHSLTVDEHREMFENPEEMRPDKPLRQRAF